MKRLFIAVDISKHARDLAAEYIAKLKTDFPDLRVVWARSENLHLTIKFLGPTSDDLIDEIKSRLSKIGLVREPFKLRLKGKGVFPSPRKASVLWLGIENDAKLIELANDVIQQMSAAGFDAEKRVFKAHLTIARIKEPREARSLVEKHLQFEYEPVDFRVDELVLYESKLHPTGSVYEKLARFPFR